jgi:hypothetical protein
MIRSAEQALKAMATNRQTQQQRKYSTAKLPSIFRKEQMEQK